MILTGSPRVEVRPASESDRAWVEDRLDDYLRELTQYREGRAGPASAAEYPFLSYYFTEPDRFPFTIRADGRPTGFALVRRITTDDDTEMQVAEFYIEPEHRHRRIGARATAALWARFPGAWQLEVLVRNRAAAEFWEHCIAEHAEGPPRQEGRRAADGRRVRYRFEVPRARRQVTRQSLRDDPDVGRTRTSDSRSD